MEPSSRMLSINFSGWKFTSQEVEKMEAEAMLLS
jgi:hypothetical protein